MSKVPQEIIEKTLRIFKKGECRYEEDKAKFINDFYINGEDEIIGRLKESGLTVAVRQQVKNRRLPEFKVESIKFEELAEYEHPIGKIKGSIVTYDIPLLEELKKLSSEYNLRINYYPTICYKYGPTIRMPIKIFNGFVVYSI